MKRIQKAVVIIVVLIYLFELSFIFTRCFLQDKPMGVVSFFMTGNYLCQPVDVVGPLGLIS